MLRNHFGNTVDLLKNLFILFVLETNAEQKLPCRRHLHLDIIQKRRILFQQFPNMRIFLRFQAILDMNQFIDVFFFVCNDFQFRNHT